MTKEDRYREDDVLVDIHTTITENERAEITSSGWAYNELIRLGMLAKKNNPQLIERVNAVEEELKIISSRLKRLEK